MRAMRQLWETALHPERYHGHDRNPPFFEGWYFKLINAGQDARFAIIPGIFLSDNPAEHHAFIQVFDGMSGHATYHRFPADAFVAAHDRFEVCIGANRFTDREITLDIDDADRRIQGTLRFDTPKPWPVQWWSPGIMGPFGWLPFMECYHGVLSFDHRIDGSLTIDGTVVDFSGGRGYIEKDWGQSFPSAWVWLQTNHFEQPNVCLTASIAVIPFAGFSFGGFIVGLWIDGTLYRFATYVGSRVERLSADHDRVIWRLRSFTHRLEIVAHRAAGAELPAPNREAMGVRVLETLNAEVEVRLTRLYDGVLEFEGTGQCAGLEVMGDLSGLEV